MTIFKNPALLSLLSLLASCGGQLVEFPQDGANGDGTGPAGPPAGDGAALDGRTTVDAAMNDTATGDAVANDGAGADGAIVDAARGDGAQVDRATVDALSGDSRLADGSIADVRSIDGAQPDANAPDVALADATVADANLVDGPLADGPRFDGGPCSQAPVVLGAAGDFVVLAGSTVTSTGPTIVTGDLGVSPGTAVTGFPPGTVIGNQHAGDPTAAQGIADLTTAYNDAAGRTLCPVTIAGNLGGQTLPPGLYKSTSSLEISSGDLVLDAQGDSNAVFIFQMASTLTTTSGRQVVLIGNAKATNVYWQVGTSATLGSTSLFQGSIMADQAITLNTGATVNGRLLARIAAINLDSNTVVKPAL